MKRMFAAVVLGVCAGVMAQPAGKTKAPAAPAGQPQERKAPTTVVSNTLGFVIRKGTEHGLETVEAARGWAIVDGEATLRAEDLQKSKNIEVKLRVDRFEPAEGTVVVKVDVNPKDRDEAFSRAMEAADKSKPPVLVDAKGRKYQPVGWVYKDPALVKLRYTRGHPVAALSELPSVTRATPDRELTLVFTVSAGVEIAALKVGDATLETFEPRLKAEGKQR